MLKETRCVVPILITSLLVSCTASQHAGVATIHQPPLAENNDSTWFSYYQDQFDAYEGKVLPPGDQYPQAAQKAYQQAKKDRESKELNAFWGTVVVTGLGIGVAVVLFSILYLSIHGTGK